MRMANLVMGGGRLFPPIVSVVYPQVILEESKFGKIKKRMALFPI